MRHWGPHIPILRTTGAARTELDVSDIRGPNPGAMEASRNITSRLDFPLGVLEYPFLLILCCIARLKLQSTRTGTGSTQSTRAGSISQLLRPRDTKAAHLSPSSS